MRGVEEGLERGRVKESKRRSQRQLLSGRLVEWSVGES